MRRIERMRWGWLGCVVALLAACGGGDGGSTAPSESALATAKVVQDADGDSWQWVAPEGHVISVRGTQTVRFGAGDSWIEKTVSDGAMCTNEYFGRDPMYGTLKECDVKVAGASAGAPVATITSPAAGDTFRAGDTVDFLGSAVDDSGRPIPPEQLTWWALLHHDSHTHPFQPETQGGSGQVTIPTRGETSANIYYHFLLRATDSSGASTTVTRDLLPQKSTLSFNTVPAGLALTLDGQPIATPLSVVGVVGMERDLGADEQTFNGRRFRFDHWNDGGAAAHTISTPPANTTFTASFTDVGAAANQAPDVSLDADSTGTAGVPMRIEATASDADGSIEKVVFYAGNTKLGESAASPYVVNWTPNAAGTVSLTALATDNDGATTRSAAVNVQVSPASTRDLQPPSVVITAPANYQSGLMNTIRLDADARDNVAVASVEFSVDGATVAEVGAPFQASLDTNAYASGQHVVRARARDTAGNLSGWAKATVQFGGQRTQPQGFTRNERWITGLNEATSMAPMPDGRLLVCEQTGSLRVIKNGTLLREPMLRVGVDAAGERGLLGVALHPRFSQNGWVYVYYTTPRGGAHNRISRFTASGDGVVGGETVLVDLPVLSSATNHNGGAMHFGTDGKLYVGVGENSEPENSQNLGTPLGKMLRFNDDGSMPTDNPFYSRGGWARAVWGYGLRNPFTFAMQPGTGKIYINDVGQDTWEEVNIGAPGANYGWPQGEGPQNNRPGVTAPLFTYKHSPANPPGSGPGGFFIGDAIAGGAFYPGNGPFPANYRGSYFFADYVDQFIGRLDPSDGSTAYAFASLSDLPVDLMVGTDGALYALTRTGITRISAN